MRLRLTVAMRWIVAGLSMLSGAAPAQTGVSDMFAPEIAAARRLEFVGANLPLTASEAHEFWPLYRAYRKEVAAIDLRLGNLLGDYGRYQDQMTDDIAEALITGYLEIESSRLKLKRRYFRKFKRVLPIRKAVRCLQIEQKLDAASAYRRAETVPLVN